MSSCRATNANVQYSLWTNGKKHLERYVKDHRYFCALDELVGGPLWAEYERLISQTKEQLR